MPTVRVADLVRLGSAAGTRFRNRRSGPESDLVDRFVDALPLGTPRDCRTTLFREPRLLSGFPRPRRSYVARPHYRALDRSAARDRHLGPAGTSAARLKRAGERGGPCSLVREGAHPV